MDNSIIKTDSTVPFYAEHRRKYAPNIIDLVVGEPKLNKTSDDLEPTRNSKYGLLGGRTNTIHPHIEHYALRLLDKWCGKPYEQAYNKIRVAFGTTLHNDFKLFRVRYMQGEPYYNNNGIVSCNKPIVQNDESSYDYINFKRYEFNKIFDFELKPFPQHLKYKKVWGKVDSGLSKAEEDYNSLTTEFIDLYYLIDKHHDKKRGEFPTGEIHNWYFYNKQNPNLTLTQMLDKVKEIKLRLNYLYANDLNFMEYLYANGKLIPTMKNEKE